MTPTQRRQCLSVLGWDQRQYARRIGWDEGTVRRWMRDGGAAPAELDAWLAGLVQAVERYGPPPERKAFHRSNVSRQDTHGAAR